MNERSFEDSRHLDKKNQICFMSILFIYFWNRLVYIGNHSLSIIDFIDWFNLK